MRGLTDRSRYKTIDRLVNDVRPENTYRQGMYTSITGGGSGSKPLFFATDTMENRFQRLTFGQFICNCGIIEKGDWALTVHTAGELYRSLDLTLEILENSGACALSAGDKMAPADVLKLLIKYHINVLAGPSSNIVHLVSYISTHPDCQKLRLNKIVYTSEVLTKSQRAFIKGVFGDIKIFSILGSAEAGPWAVSSPDITGESTDSIAEFIYDKRTMLLEILPFSAGVESTSYENGTTWAALPQGERGVIVQTSLIRLRNPLIRYITGDIGSIHALPEGARNLVPESEWEHLQVIRLEGRDKRFSFDWDNNYLDFGDLSAIMNDSRYRILQWQVILGRVEGTAPETMLDIRLLAAVNDELREEITRRIQTFVHLVEKNQHKFNLLFLEDLDGFERSGTGRKVIKFLDRST